MEDLESMSLYWYIQGRDRRSRGSCHVAEQNIAIGRGILIKQDRAEMVNFILA